MIQEHCTIHCQEIKISKKDSKDDNASTKNMYVGEVVKAQFGPAIGAHAGPGAVGVAFIGDAPE